MFISFRFFEFDLPVFPGRPLEGCSILIDRGVLNGQIQFIG